MKKLSAAFITIALIFSLTICTAAQADLPSPTSEFFVNDFAGVLSNSAEETINHMGKALEDMTGAQVVVVTVQSLDGQDIDSYANELFRKWGIGEKDRNNGVLILNSVSDRMLRIEVGYGLEGALTDIETAEIRTEYMNPYLKEGNYDSGILNGYTAVVNAVCEEYGIDMDDLLQKMSPDSLPDYDYYRQQWEDRNREEHETGIPFAVLAFFAFLAIDGLCFRFRITRILLNIAFFNSVFGDGRRGRGRRGGRGGFGGGGFGGGGFGGRGGGFGGGGFGGFGGGGFGGSSGRGGSSGGGGSSGRY